MNIKIKIFLIATFFILMLSPAIHSIRKNENPSLQNFLTVCTIFKDEAPWLKEWIEYNKLIGVDHFRLYNNHSTDNYLEILAPYIEAREVTLIDWPGGHGNWCYEVQGTALLDGISQLSGISKWVALIDTDEFLLPTDKENMQSFLEEYESFAALVINWQIFGTSGVHSLSKNELLIEALTLKAPEQSWWNQPVKSIVRPECVDTSRLYLPPHQWHYLPNYFPVNPNKQPFVYGEIDVDKIRINHYIHRTEEYFWTEKLQKKAIMERYPSDPFIKKWRESCNIEEDRSIQRFVPQLREKVFP